MWFWPLLTCQVIILPQSRQSFWNFWARGHKDEQDERAKSEGATPLSSPQKWTGAGGGGGGGKGPPVEELGALGKSEEAGKEKGEGSVDLILGASGEERLGGVVVSTDEESEGGGRDIAKRPRQRSKRGKKIGFTNILTSEQLVRDILLRYLMYSAAHLRRASI